LQAGKSFTAEAQIFIPNQENATQIVFQKLSEDGFCFYLEPSNKSYVSGVFCFVSGAVSNSTKYALKKGTFNHICLSLNRELGENILEFYLDGEQVAVSKKEKSFETFENKSNLLIGSGSSFYLNGGLVSPAQTFSGSIDEFRIFHSHRSSLQQKIYATKGLYSSADLKLYYRFNEPSSLLSSNGDDPVNSIVLDSSGNSLHSYISNFSTSLRRSSTGDVPSPLTNEKSIFKTILFPYYEGVTSLNTRLLSSASAYDFSNPNLITKLIPSHYLREGGLENGFSNENPLGDIGKSYSGQGIPGEGKLGSSQIILTFLYIWAKFFDEIKLFVDAFKNLRTVEYSTQDTIPDNFLHDYIRAYGFCLPPLFNSSNVMQYVEGEDINGISVADLSLKKVQAQLIRRVLVNMPDILRSKGTQHSIRSFLRSIGIDPDNSLRIREFGGPSIHQMYNSREIRTEPNPVVDFLSGSLITTNFLSSSRVEPGYPTIEGSFVDGISNSKNDGLLTSGSWTVEGLFRYGPLNKQRLLETQSLIRMEVTGSSSNVNPGVIVNVTALSGSLFAFIRPGMSVNSPTLKMSIPADVLDGQRWNVSFGCSRNDSINSVVSSSYFLRAASVDAGDINDLYASSSFFREETASEGNAFRKISSTLNASGSRIAIGKEDFSYGSMGHFYLNDTLESEEAARSSQFVGQVSNIRFWSKALTEDEWKEHVRNYKSYGVADAKKNFNYVKNMSGSFEKLRMSVLEKQEIQTADKDGNIDFLDFSQNNNPAFGSGFTKNSKVTIGDIFSYSFLSPYFDEYSSGEKIRIRSFQNERNILSAPWAQLAPVYELDKEETPNDDPRLSIEFSLVDSLNKDIMRMFSTLDELGNAIGSPELMFSPDYPDLERLRDIYFNRLSEKLNFRGFFEFFRWFDNSISTFIEQLVPRKTRFKGTNFVIESHVLERHKMEYQSSEIYLGDATRSRIRDTLLVQQISGQIGRF
jgi:hypothetical protein